MTDKLTVAQACEQRDAWYALAQHHLQVAQEQHGLGRFDITVFHAYHAYECLLCAYIASFRWPVPPSGGTRIDEKDYYQGPVSKPVSKGEHDARAKFVAQLLPSAKPYHDDYVRLDGRRHWRNECLYIEGGKLPSIRFPQKDADWCLKNVKRFMQELWKDIQNKPPTPPPSADNTTASPPPVESP